LVDIVRAQRTNDEKGASDEARDQEMAGKIAKSTAALLVTALAGCVGVPAEKMDSEKSIAAVRTSAQRPAVVACLTSRLSDVDGGVSTVPDAGQGLTRLLIGKPQVGTTRYFYQLDVLEMSGGGSNITVRRAPAPFTGLSRARLQEVIDRCAPPI
jgi:hypothetical protein